MPNNSDFLHRQEVMVRSDIQSKLAELRGDVLTAADPKAWVKIAPWGTVGLVAAAAFAATVLVVPARRKSVAPQPAAAGESMNPRAEAATAAPRKGAIWGTVSALLYSVGRLIFTEILNAALQPDVAHGSTMPEDAADLSATDSAAEYEAATF